jgi:hypothetical protein
VRGRLIGEHIRHDAARDERLEQLHRIRDDTDRDRLTLVARFERTLDGGIERRCLLVEIALLEPALNACRIDVGDQRGCFIHRRRKRLRATHPAQSRGDDELPPQRVAEVFLRDRGKAFIRPLQNPLRADVDP